MEQAHWKKADELLQQALELPTGERDSFLEQACNGDEALKTEVASLLAADRQMGEFLNQPLLQREAEPAAAIGRRIGAYRIEREIGRGGMGAVYLASRDDQQFDQRAAIKLIKRGMDTDEIVERFRHERRILASLNHPNIARLLDGGTTEDGLPYFVMEYIEGEPLLEFCQRKQLGVAERLKLFLQICSAVQHAHNNLIVHRDLKPSNILVIPAADGNTETVKLLDFGIAKLLNAEEAGLSTLSGQRPMTPEYASPEQIRGEAISTASDVYSLGVVLYELLTGQRPYRVPQGSAEEINRFLREQEPQLPSQTTQSDKLRRQLKGDLDNIVMMALRKELSRRYNSAEQLSEDIRRNLEGQPVTACQDTFGYRGAKFIRRHRAGVAAAMAILLTLVAGIVATTRQARIAERRFGEVRQLANNFLFTFDEAIEKLPGSTPARRLIVSTALEYLDRLAREASGDAQLLGELAAAYIKVGDLQGNPYFPNIGDLNGAEQSYLKAQAIRQELASRSGYKLESRRNLAECHDRLGDILYNRNELVEAEKLYRLALEPREAWLADGHTDKDSRNDLAKSFDKIGSVKFWLGAHAEAREWYQRALALREALAAEFPGDYIFGRGLCASHTNIGDLHVQQDEYDSGIASYEQVRRIAQHWVTVDPANAQAQRDLGLSHSKLGEALAWADNPEESLAHHREALSIRQRLATSDPANKQARRDLAISHTFLGMLLAANKRLPEGQEEVRQSVEIFEALRRSDPTNSTAADDLIIAYNRQGRLLVNADPEAGLESFRKSLAVGEERAAKDPNDTSPLRGLASTTQFLGEKCARLAAEKTTPANLRAERWRQAIGYFRRYLEVAMALQQRGALNQSETASIEKVRGQLAQCETELLKLNQQ